MTTYVFDVGETLVSEARTWGQRADELGIPRPAFFAALGAVIQDDRHHWDVYDFFDVDRAAFYRKLDARQDPRDGLLAEDLYSDAAPALQGLVDAGHRVGLAANQPERAAAELEAMGLPISFLATSAGWGISKPDPEFFRRVIEIAEAPASDIVYVGDRLDNDVLPAKTAGMHAVLIRRGPWGFLHAARPAAANADRIIDSLTELL